MRRILWSASAVDELASIITYISRSSPVVAERVADQLEATVLALAEQPIGRAGRVAGTFEKVLTGLPYFIAYALGDDPAEDEILTLLRIIHEARDWPEGGWPGE